jgi:hypothetical protein
MQLTDPFYSVWESKNSANVAVIKALKSKIIFVY